MRILIAHNYYQQSGGEDGVLRSETELLKRHGNDITLFTVTNDSISSARTAHANVALGATATWSRESRAKVSSLARKCRADIVHFHNTFPLISPAAYSAAREGGAAVVQTLHNFRLVCPNALLFRDGHVCEDCVGRPIPFPGVVHACYRGSRPQTAVVGAMTSIHRGLGTYRRNVDRYIALSENSRSILVRGGLPEDKVVVKPNFLETDVPPSDRLGTSFVFVGRMIDYKGAALLPRAWSNLAGSVPLKMIGDGPQLEQITQAAAGRDDINMHGRLGHSEVIQHIQGSIAVIVPSLLYENFPLAIVEAFGCGRPVIASRLGAMAELLDDGRTGLLFTPGDAEDLARKVQWAWEHPEEMRRMGEAARREYEQKYTPERNYQMLMDIYQQAIEHRRSRSPRRSG